MASKKNLYHAALRKLSFAPKVTRYGILTIRSGVPDLTAESERKFGMMRGQKRDGWFYYGPFNQGIDGGD